MRRPRPDAPRFDAADPLLDARPDEVLDLHGQGALEGLALVRRCIESWSRSRPGIVVHIVTGKGRHSPGAPVLRTRVRTLLKGDLAPHVADWVRDAGDGGYMVRLR